MRTKRLAEGPDVDVRLEEAQGSYQLVVLNNINSCADTAMVDITIDTIAPQAIIIPPDKLDCQSHVLPSHDYLSLETNILRFTK